MKLIYDADTHKLGRNDPCLCGSGQKYKKCCLPKEDIRGSHYIHPQASSRESELILKKMGKLIEQKGANMSVDEMNEYFKGKSFDEIDEAYEAIAQNDPKSQAEAILSEAYETEDSDKCIAIAEEALSIHPNLPDAWSIFAHEKAKNATEAIIYFEKAIEVGKLDLGEEFFQENTGHFWGLTETRPYMRAKAYLADAMVEIENYDEAILQYEDCIKLNPNDNQGVRSPLLSLYLQNNRMKEAEKLLKKYKDDFGASFDFGKALFLFKKEGPESVQAIKQLNEARKNNPHVAKFLTGKKKPPFDLPDTYQMGSQEEAVIYFSESALAWINTAGALEWLANWT